MTYREQIVALDNETRDSTVLQSVQFRSVWPAGATVMARWLESTSFTPSTSTP